MSSIAGFLSSLVTILRYLPETVKLISQFLKAIKDAIDDAERKKLNDKFNKALTDAKSSKDTSDVEDLFSGNKSKPEVRVIEVKKEVEVPKEVIKPVNGLDISYKRVMPLSFSSVRSNFAINYKNSDEDVVLPMGVMSMSSMGSVALDPSVTQVTGMNLNNKISSKWIVSIALITILLNNVSCKSDQGLPGTNAPDYKPEIWAGDSNKGGISRAQTNQFLSANDPEFDNYFAVSSDTMSCIFQTYVNNCVEFKDKNVVCKSMSKRQIKKQLEELDNN